MFVISQYLLNTSGVCKNNQQISTYSIALGLILYSVVYLYILFYNDEYLNIFNNFIIYIVSVDLLLSAFYYFNIQKTEDSLILQEVEDDDDSEEDDQEDDEQDTETSDEDTDDDSELYINNLIAQARVSDQERMSKLMQKIEELPVAEQEEQQAQFGEVLHELVPVHEVEQPEPELEQEVREELQLQEPVIVTKKKGGARKKTST